MKLAILPDFAEERWPSMDLCAANLARCAREIADIDVQLFQPQFRRRWSVLPGKLARNADRFRNRMKEYPRQLRGLSADCFHVVDHSYSQLLHELPRGRGGVYCHDLDTFRCALTPAAEPRPAWFVRMTQRILEGFQSAAVVFHSTDEIRRQILEHRLIEETRLVKAPLGVSDVFFAPTEQRGVADLTATPFVLHVGSCIPRKRIDVLLNVFSALRQKHNNLRLIQIGGEWNDQHRALLARLPVDSVVQRRGISDAELAWLYHRSAAVLLPTAAEGFCLPLIEALAGGANVLASDLPVLREVGGEAVTFARVGEIDEWVEKVGQILSRSNLVASETKLAHARRFTWQSHAQIIVNAYRKL